MSHMITASLPGSVSPSLPYVVLDVFSGSSFAGNPLAVVLDAERLSTEQMQRIAREFNLSETTFPLSPSSDQRTAGADYVLRIFTPQVELPFAGHPSVGSAWWLAQIGRIPTGLVRQQCGAGLLPVEVTDHGATLTGGTATVGEPIDSGPALAAIGLPRDALADPDVQVSSTGLAYAVIFVKPEFLPMCRPDMSVLRDEFSYPQEATGVYAVVWDAGARHAQARMFAGDLGSPEDPATGSAALALGARLVSAGAFPDGQSTFTIDQGVDMGRPSRLVVTCDVASGVVDRLRVSGDAVLVAEGRIGLPAS